MLATRTYLRVLVSVLFERLFSVSLLLCGRLVCMGLFRSWVNVLLAFCPLTSHPFSLPCWYGVLIRAEGLLAKPLLYLILDVDKWPSVSIRKLYSYNLDTSCVGSYKCF